jgi:hypothetical protein
MKTIAWTLLTMSALAATAPAERKEHDARKPKLEDRPHAYNWPPHKQTNPGALLSQYEMLKRIEKLESEQREMKRKEEIKEIMRGGPDGGRNE